MPAVPVHHTSTDDGVWDGPAQVKKLNTPLTAKIGDDVFAWVDPDADETTKSAWRFTHHFVSAAGYPGAASTLACSTAIGILNGARTGTTIPDGDREGVWRHLAAHLSDAGVDHDHIPQLRSATGLELRSVGGGLNLTGYASVFDHPYDVGQYRETIKPGAFTKTLAEGAEVPLLVNHEGLPLASTRNGTLKLSEDRVGLKINAQLDPNDPESQTLMRKIRTGLLGEMSFAFRAVRQSWSDDYSQRTITEASINKGDVSVVTFGANPATSVNADGESDPPMLGARASTIADRKAMAERIGNRVAIREARGFQFQEPPAPISDGQARTPHIPDYAGRAREWLELEELRFHTPARVRARLEALRYSPPTRKAAPARKAGPVSAERAWLNAYLAEHPEIERPKGA